MRRAAPDGGLRALLIRRLPMVHWQTIELGLRASGVPDVNGCLGGIEFWVECKTCVADAVRFRPGQVGWMERRLRAGGHVLVAVRRRCGAGARRAARDELLLMAGWGARHAQTGGLVAALPWRLGHWEGGPERWDWDAVLRVMTTGATDG